MRHGCRVGVLAAAVLAARGLVEVGEEDGDLLPVWLR
jgi:hypothetical protein